MTPTPKSELMARLRQERKEAGLIEVRGIWVPRELVSKIKEYAERLRSEHDPD